MARYALVVGITDYTKPLLKLSKAATDAETVALLLRQNGDFQQVELLKGAVTGEELGQALKMFLQEQTVNSEVLIYFTGNAITLSDELEEEQGYLATSDCAIAIEDRKIVGQKGGIALASLNNLIRRSDLSSLVVILDCCHGGHFLERNLIEQTFTAFSSRKDYYLIAACPGFQEAYATSSDRHSIFTGAMLKGLSPENAGSDGQVSGDSLFDFIASKLKGSGQEPMCMGWGGSMTLVSYQPKKTAAVVDDTCPYQGLEPFNKERARFFFGREKVIQLLIEKLEQANFIPLMGASGSGKSSVVRAGLIPHLEKNGWRVLDPIKPGIEPLAKLQAAFEPFFGHPKEMQQQLYACIHNDQDGLRFLIELLPGSGRYLLVVDQFEELFTLGSKEEDRRRFIQLLTQVAKIPDSRLAVVCTIRTDFLKPCLHYPSLTGLIQAQVVYMPPLVGADLEQAITEPAKLQGYGFEEALHEEIVQDVGKDPGCLPLLQFALTKLWEKRDQQKHQLTMEQYRALGGVIGALACHAEQIYSKQEGTDRERETWEKEWIKRLFLKLVRTGQGVKDTRQRQTKAKLLTIAGDNPQNRQAINDVLNKLTRGRLLVTAQEDRPEEVWVELAHEALMESWGRFAQWRQENRELRRLIDRVEDALREWQKNPKDENLMMGDLLAQVREKWLELEPDLDVAAREFYQQSNARKRGWTAAVFLVRTAEGGSFGSQPVDRDRQGGIPSLSPKSPKSLQPTTYDHTPIHSGSKARLEEQAARVSNLLCVQPLDGLVLAIQLTGLSFKELGNVISPVQNALHRAIEIARECNTLRGHSNSVSSVAFSLDRLTIVSGSLDGTVRVWDWLGNPIRQPFQGHEDSVRSVAFSPDSLTIVSGSDDRTLRLWNWLGRPIGQPLRGHEDCVNSVAFSPDGKTIVSGSHDKTVRLWDLQGNPIGQPFLGHKDSVLSVAFSPDGKTIVSGSHDKTVRLWDLQGNPIGQPFLGHEDSVNSVAFSPDGQTIVSSSQDKTVRLWDLQGNPIGQPLQGHEDSVNSVAFSPDNRTIVSSSDKTVRLWDLQGNPIGQPFLGHEEVVLSVAFSPDGQTVVSGSQDKTVRLWEVPGNAIAQPFHGHTSDVFSVAFSPDGQTIVSGSGDWTLQLWDLQGNPIGQPFRGHEDYVCSVAFSPDGRSIVSGSWDGTLRLWDLQGNPIAQPFQGHEDCVNSVAFSPDGQTIVSGSQDMTVRLWDLQGNPIAPPFQGHDGGVLSVAFSRDGRTIVSGSHDMTLRLWDLQGNPMGLPFHGHEDSVWSVGFSPDGQTIVSGSKDKTLRLWDFHGNPIGQTFKGHEDSVWSVAFSPDGQTIVSGSWDGTLRLWDLEGNSISQPFQGHKDYVCSVAFSPDGQTIVSGSSDRTVRLWQGGNWKTWLQVAYNRLRNHPVFKNPQSEAATAACETCQK